MFFKGSSHNLSMLIFLEFTQEKSLIERTAIDGSIKKIWKLYVIRCISSHYKHVSRVYPSIHPSILFLSRFFVWFEKLKHFSRFSRFFSSRNEYIYLASVNSTDSKDFYIDVKKNPNIKRYNFFYHW